MNTMRTRWAAIGAAVAVTLGGGGIGLVTATSPSDASSLVQITACRLVDTRSASQVGPRGAPLGPSETYTVAAHGANGNCKIPTTATGLSLNVTAVDPTEPTFLTFWDEGAVPLAANLNPTPGQPPTPNAVFVPLSGAGSFNVFNKFGNVHAVIDVNAYTTDHHHDDHHHDDRYYTKAETDATYFDRDALDDLFYTEPEIDAMLRPDPVVVPASAFTHADMDWVLGPTTIEHVAGADDCATAPVSLPAGHLLSRVRTTYSGGSGDVDVVIQATHLTEGPAADRGTRAIFDLPPFLGSRNDVLMAPVSFINIETGFAHRLEVCTPDGVLIDAIELYFTPTPKT